LILDGHIRKRTKNSWAVVLSLGRDPATGKKRQKWYGGFKSRREAQAKRTRLLADWEAGSWTPPTKLTTGEFLERWLRDYARGACGPVTFANYESAIRTSIIPALGHIPLVRLGPQAVQGYYSALGSREVMRGRGRRRLGTSRTVSAGTVHTHHRLLRTALGHAVRWGLIAAIPQRSRTRPVLPAARSRSGMRSRSASSWARPGAAAAIMRCTSRPS
jgi:hypothetical protein